MEAHMTTNKQDILQIGWASGDITPDKPTLISGQFHARVSEGVMDPVTATALALGQPDSNSQAILMSCDLLWIDASVMTGLRKELASRISGFDPMNLILGATHIHTGPETVDNMYPPAPEGVITPAQYKTFLIPKLADIAAEAWNNRKPGGISRAFNYAVVGHNRRAAYLDGSSKMYGACNCDNFAGMEGFEDHGIDMLWTWDDKKQLTGVVLNLACPAQVSENLNTVSADFWHETRIELKKAFSENLFILPQPGSAGDQSPHPMIHKTRETDMLKRMGITQRDAIARRITSAVQEVYEAAKADIRTNAEIAHIVKTIELPMKEVTDEEIAEAKSQIEEFDKILPASAEGLALDKTLSAKWVRRTWFQGVLKRAELQKKGETFKMELNVLRVGDVAFCTNPFELYLVYGICIKSRSPAFQTFVIQLSCGKGGWGGYLPTERALAGKSYSGVAGSCAVGPEGGRKLVEDTLETLNAMWKN